MTTIRDIAKLANVSTATVSRILNNSGKVKPETKAKVEKIIKENNYHPNQVARSLYKKKSKMIGIIVPDLNNMFYAKIIDGIQSVLQANDYSILISFSAGADINKYYQFINEFKQNNIDGIITSSFDITDDQNLGIPLVIYDSANIDDHFVRIASNNIKGGIESVNLLKNVKNVIIQHFGFEFPTVKERVTAMTHELKKRNINYHLEKLDKKSYYTSLKVFNQYHDFDAIITTNDIAAIQLIKEAKKRNLNIPQDLQIVGYDNDKITEYTDPTISTIDQHPYLIGITAAKRLLSLLNGDTSYKNSIIDVTPVKRQSTI